MKEPSAYSPFAAMTPQEQRHRWTVWQAQQMPVQPVAAAQSEPEAQNRPNPKQTDVCTLIEELSEKPQQPLSELTLPPLRAAIRHSQYDAVMKRMQQASRQAGQFASVPGAGSVMQPSSGNA